MLPNLSSGDTHSRQRSGRPPANISHQPPPRGAVEEVGKKGEEVAKGEGGGGGGRRYMEGRKG